MTKKDKHPKQNIGRRILKWFATPEDKSIKLPEGKIAVNAVDYDLMRSCLVVSVLINLVLFIVWLLVKLGGISLVAIIDLMIS